MSWRVRMTSPGIGAVHTVCGSGQRPILESTLVRSCGHTVYASSWRIGLSRSSRTCPRQSYSHGKTEESARGEEPREEAWTKIEALSRRGGACQQRSAGRVSQSHRYRHGTRPRPNGLSGRVRRWPQTDHRVSKVPMARPSLVSPHSRTRILWRPQSLRCKGRYALRCPKVRYDLCCFGHPADQLCHTISAAGKCHAP